MEIKNCRLWVGLFVLLFCLSTLAADPAPILSPHFKIVVDYSPALQAKLGTDKIASMRILLFLGDSMDEDDAHVTLNKTIRVDSNECEVKGITITATQMKKMSTINYLVNVNVLPKVDKRPYEMNCPILEGKIRDIQDKTFRFTCDWIPRGTQSHLEAVEIKKSSSSRQ